MDESAYIQAVLYQDGVDGRCETLTPACAWALVDEVIAVQGEPLFGYSMLAQHQLYGLARAYNTTVVLEGNGADEILGGYPFYEAVRLRERLTRGQWWSFGVELRCLAEKYARSPWSILRSHVLSYYTYQLTSRWLRRPYDWWSPDAPRPDPASARLGRSTDYGHDPSALNRLLYYHTKHTNLPCILLRLDRCSMAHSIETRVPYLDHRLVEFCFRLPASYKVGFGDRKCILRSAGRLYVPRLITERTDKKAIASTEYWIRLRQPHEAEALRDMVASPTMRQLPWLCHSSFERFIEDYLAHKHQDTPAVWRLYTAWRWLEIFRPRLPAKGWS